MGTHQDVRIARLAISTFRASLYRNWFTERIKGDPCVITRDDLIEIDKYATPECRMLINFVACICKYYIMYLLYIRNLCLDLINNNKTEKKNFILFSLKFRFFISLDIYFYFQQNVNYRTVKEILRYIRMYKNNVWIFIEIKIYDLHISKISELFKCITFYMYL